jgi:four helix bundle protein
MDYDRTERRNKNRGYMKLIVWQEAMQLFELVWKTAFESKLYFQLRAQLADAAQSISANISEGYGRRSVKEYIPFLYVALGSVAETLRRTIGLFRTGQIGADEFEEIDLLHYEVENRLLRLIEKLEEKRDDGDWTARIAEDPLEHLSEPTLEPLIHPSTALSLHRSDA